MSKVAENIKDNRDDGGLAGLNVVRHSQGHSTPLLARVRPSEATDFSTFKQTVTELDVQIKSGSQLFQRLNDSQMLDLELLISSCESLLKRLSDFVAVTNALPAPVKERDLEVGKAMLPLAIRAWSKSLPQKNAELLYSLYKKVHTDQEAGRLKIDTPEWMLGVLPYISFSQEGTKFPDRRAYIVRSAVLSPKLQEIEGRANQILVRLSGLKEKNEKAIAHSGKAMFDEGIATLEEKLKETNAEVAPLFDDIKDVAPETVDEALNALDLKVSLNPKIFQETLELIYSIERVLLAANLAATGSDLQATELRVPILTGGGNIEVYKASLTGAELKEIGKNAESLSKLVGLLDFSRATLRELLPTVPYVAGLAANAQEKLRRPLTQIFSKYGANGENAIKSMFDIKSPLLDAALAKLFSQVIVTDPKSEKAGFVLENHNNAPILSWAISRYVSADKSEKETIFRVLLESSKTVAEALGGIVDHARDLWRQNDLEALALFFSEQIKAQEESSNTLRSLGLTLLISHFAQDPQIAPRLRYQIPNIETLKDIIGSIYENVPGTKSYLSKSVHQILKNLSASMADFYRGEHGEELWEFIETFRFYMDNPKILEGVEGNEGMRSGILLIGRPGVGKTHLATCLQNELGIKMFCISPEQKKSDETMIDVAKRLIEEAKEHEGPCIIFIDEAEAIMADRENPRTTPAQAELTDYLLQEVNLLRRLYPKVLVIAATNYEERIDEAMMREGRLDYHIYMGPPGPETRRAIIVDTLVSKKIPLHLNDGEVTQLVELSDKFMPLPIKRTIIETDRVYGPLKRSKGEEFSLTFDILKERFEAERKRHLKRFERQKKKGSSFLDSNGEASAVL